MESGGQGGRPFPAYIALFYIDGIIYNISTNKQTAEFKILIGSLYVAFWNGMCFIIHESLKIKLQP